MSAPTCVRCGRPTPDGYSCAPCSGIAARQLATIAELTEAARDVAHGQSRRGPTIAGTNEHGIELNLSAQARLDAIQNELTTWARHVAEERGRVLPWEVVAGPACRTCIHETCEHIRDWSPDALVASSRFLGRRHVEWLRHRAEVDEFLAAIDASARLITGIIDGAPPMLYLGPCGGEIETNEPCPVNCACHNGPDYPCDEPGGCGSAGCRRSECKGDIYARQGHDTGRCRSCGATIDVEVRRQWLDDQVRGTLFRAVHIAEAYGINVNTIRSWYDRGRLAAHGEEDGKPTFLVGEVLDLAADAAKRRAENEAKRARRAA